MESGKDSGNFGEKITSVRYATIKDNDIANGDGIGVAVFLQGCPHHCPDCFNPETWDYNGGKEFTNSTMQQILKCFDTPIEKHLSILGGEPLCPQNKELSYKIIKTVKNKYPKVKVYLWTGYLYEQIKDEKAVSLTDFLIDGPFIKEQKELNLKWRGSKNQRIFYLKGKDNE